MKTMRINNRQLKKLVAESINQNLLQEGILDFITSLPSSALDAIQQAAGEWIVQRLGLEPDSFFGRAIANAIENIDLTDLSAVLSGDRGACVTLVRRILESIAEALIEKFLEETLGLDIEGPIASPLREAMMNALIRDNKISNSIADVICGMTFGDVVDASNLDLKNIMTENKKLINLQEKLTRIRKLEKNKKMI